MKKILLEAVVYLPTVELRKLEGGRLQSVRSFIFGKGVE